MIIQSVAGLFVFSGIAWLISENRTQVKIKRVIAGIAIQLAIGFILLKLPVFRSFFISLNHLVLSLEASTKAGTSMVFGYIGGGELPFAEKFPGSSFILAFQALPLILVISALSSLMFYWKILPLVVRSFSYALQKTLGLGGAEGLGVSANIFVGMVESPLFIRPYLKEMTRSEIFTLMTSGMATIAGALMGTKTVLNEFLAYLDMSRLPQGTLNPKSLIIMTYAMCGFANPGSLGIMIGGMGTMAPEKRDEIVSLGFRSIIAGTLATCMTGAVVGIIG